MGAGMFWAITIAAFMISMAIILGAHQITEAIKESAKSEEEVDGG
jgi:hypothetical protein